MEHVSVVWWVAFGGILTVIALSLAATRETVRLAEPGVGGSVLEPVSLGLGAVTAEGGGDGGALGEGDQGGGFVGAGDAGGHAGSDDGGGVGHGSGEGGDGDSVGH